MKRYFVMRQFTGIERRPVFVMFQDPTTLVYYHRRVYAFSDTAGSPITRGLSWSRTYSGSFSTLTNPDMWIEIAPDNIEVVWSRIGSMPRSHDAMNDPIIAAARVAPTPIPRPPIKTSNTKHKIGVPKNRLP